MKIKLTTAALAAAMSLNSTTIQARSLKDEVCDGHKGFYSFSLALGDKCPGERFGTLCSVECSSTHSKKHIKMETLETKIRQAHTPAKGKAYTVKEIRAARRYLAKWGEEDISKLIKELNGNLSDEERMIFRGALKYWPFLKYHSDRLGIDPRLVFLVAVTESKMLQEKGKTGDIGVMMVIPPTMEEMYAKHGINDPILKKAGKEWRKEKDVIAVLGLYYLKDAIKRVGVEGVSFPDLTEQQKIYIYLIYNSGNKIYKNGNIDLVKLEQWWQGNNYANCAEKYMRLYTHVESFVDQFIAMHNVVEKKEAVLASKPKTEEKQKRKEALVKKLDSKIAEHLIAKEVVTDKINSNLAIASKDIKSEHKTLKSPLAVKSAESQEKKETKKNIQLAKQENTSKQLKPISESLLAQNKAENPIPQTHSIEPQKKKDAEEKVVKLAKVAEKPKSTAQKPQLVSTAKEVKADNSFEASIQQVTEEQKEIRLQLKELQRLLSKK